MQMPLSLSLGERRHDHEEQEGSSSFTIIDLIRKHWHPIRVTDKYRNQLTTLIGGEREKEDCIIKRTAATILNTDPQSVIVLVILIRHCLARC